MPALPTYQARTFGPATSTIPLAVKGGAVLGGIWISAKGTAPVVAVYDSASASPPTGKLAIASTALTAIGLVGYPPLETGVGLQVTVKSCTGTIFWRPGAAGGA